MSLQRTAELIHATHQIHDVRVRSERQVARHLVSPLRSETERGDEIDEAVGASHLVKEFADRSRAILI